MYAQMIKTDSDRLKDLSELSPEDRAFQERIDRGEKIEPKEYMPEGYRKMACPLKSDPPRCMVLRYGSFLEDVVIKADLPLCKALDKK